MIIGGIRLKTIFRAYNFSIPYKLCADVIIGVIRHKTIFRVYNFSIPNKLCVDVIIGGNGDTRLLQLNNSLQSVISESDLNPTGSLTTARRVMPT